MTISDLDYVRVLRSEHWSTCGRRPLDDLNCQAIRDLDFGDKDCSVFAVDKLDWSSNSEALAIALEAIAMRIVFSSTKFHVRTMFFLKLDTTAINEKNISHLDDRLGCHHYDLVDITFGQMKLLIAHAYDALSHARTADYRVFSLADIRGMISRLNSETIRNLLIEANHLKDLSDTTQREKAEKLLRQIKNVYFRNHEHEFLIKLESVFPASTNP